ncbi:DNA polymerase alpha subunit B [Amia ocellicauda]|uniref:DNA polymerase alpha subunit B n=1 Tax=Amia ocellicauda TaxID=2972642 RepID=UPI003463EADC
MAADTTEAIQTELKTFDVKCEDEEVLDKMVEQCMSHRMKGEDIVLEWVAFSTTKGGWSLSLDSLEQFEHEVLNKRASKFRPSMLKKDVRVGQTNSLESLKDLIRAEEEEEDLLDSYTTPAKGSQKRALSTPENPQSKRSVSVLPSPRLLLSPTSFSPSATPSQKYGSRSGRGEAVVSWGALEGMAWAGRGGRGVTLRPLGGPEEPLTNRYRFMFQKLRDVRDVLSERIEELGTELKTRFNIEEFSSVSMPAQDSVAVLGQVCCDSNGKLNAQSVVLEGEREQSSGGRVPLQLSELPEYSLFPGQVVVLEGLNTTGRKLVVSRLYEGVPLPFHTAEGQPEDTAADDPLMVMVACGPFTPSDSLNYEPLLDLIETINRDRPDVCVLLGPFLDSRHEQVEKGQLTATFEEVFRKCVRSVIEGTRSVHTRLVLVPSQRDVQHLPVYPQPPFTIPDLSKDDKERVCLVSDPCTLLIGGVVFGLTSTDILFHMGAEEISSAAGSDRFTRILKHILTQRSYYPLYPPAEEVNVDYERFLWHAQLPCTPDVLIVPSELRYFIKDVIGCVCINPGRLTKGQVGGTYGRLLIQAGGIPLAEGKRQSPCLAGQVVKI